jgi:HEAT repeat protein
VLQCEKMNILFAMLFQCTIMKTRRLIAVTFFLLVLGGLLAFSPIRIQVVGFFRGENFFQGLPTSYWRQQAVEHGRFRKERSTREWGGLVVVPPSRSPTCWTDSLLSVFRMIAGTEDPDFRVFQGDAAALAVLMDLLRDPEPGIRQSACEGLEEIGPPAAPAVPALIERLIAGEPPVRGHAAEALGKIGAAAVRPLLEKLSSEANGEEAIFLTLGNIGPDAAPAILVLLAAVKDKNRHDASRALGRIGPRAVPALLEALESSDWQVRWGATLALSKTHADPDILVPVFVQLLNDKDGVVRQAAAGGLGELGAAAQEGVPALIAALKDRERYAAREAIDALGSIGPKAQAAVPVLTRMLEIESDDYMRQCVQRALKNIKADSE